VIDATNFQAQKRVGLYKPRVEMQENLDEDAT